MRGAAGGAQAPTAGAQQLKTRGGGETTGFREIWGEGENILLKNLGHIDKSLLTKY